jgi:hypothetical protein
MHLFFSARPDPSSDALRPRWRERCDRDDERRYFEVSLTWNGKCASSRPMRQPVDPKPVRFCPQPAASFVAIHV